MLDSKVKEVQDATELANSLRLQLVRERKAAEEKTNEAHASLLVATKEVSRLQHMLSHGKAAPAATAATKPAGSAAKPAADKEKDKDNFQDLDARWATPRQTPHAEADAPPSHARPHPLALTRTLTLTPTRGWPS